MKKGLLLLLMAAVMAASGCSTSRSRGSDPTTPVEGGTLNLGLYAAPDRAFHPLFSENRHGNRVGGLLYSGLLRPDADLSLVCDLCSTFEVSDDNRVITFTLRRDVSWHDGRPFTANDVVFTFRTVLHPDYRGAYSDGYAALAGVQKMLDERDRIALLLGEEKITSGEASRERKAAWQTWLEGDGQRAILAVDDFTVRFETDLAYAPILPHLAFPVLPAHLLARVPFEAMKEHQAVRQPVGTGPYRFVSQDLEAPAQQRFVLLERHEGYYLGKPYIPTIRFHLVSRGEALELLKNGELDHAYVGPEAPALLQEAQSPQQAGPMVQVVERPALGYQYMGLNHEHPALGDPLVRQALMYGIDRQGLVDRLLNGHGFLVRSHMLPGIWAYDEQALEAYPHDLTKAQALLAEAGWTERDAHGYLTRDGQSLAFTLSYPEGNQTREASAPLIQADLKAIGIKVTLKKMPFDVLAREVFTTKEADAWLLGWDLGLDPDPGPVFLTNNKWGRATGWVSDRNEELIRQGVRLLSPAERKPLYVEWSRILNQELPYLFLYAPSEIEAVNSRRIMGLKPDLRGPLWNIHALWIPTEKQRKPE